jgi:ferredoxin
MMEAWVLGTAWVVLALVGIGAAAFFLTCLHERKSSAALRVALTFTPLVAIGVGLLAVSYPGRTWIVLALLIAAGVAVLLVVVPMGPRSSLRIVGDMERIDERDAVFHRFSKLKPGTPEFEQFYENHPELRRFDELVRELPRLCHPGSRSYHTLSSAYTSATFEVLEQLASDIDWEPAPIEGMRVDVDAEEITKRIKGFCRYLGADLVGTTALNPAYIYSHRARGSGAWGTPIDLDHPNAIAIAVRMSHDMVRHAPDVPAVTETSFRYFECAKIAMIVAKYINLLGYEARAHVDGNYQVMCPPIAADAGLGELGRLGLLMHPKFGPRMRLAVVSTDLPLAFDQPISFGVQDFCTFCRKCATNCPSGSIDGGEKQVHNGVEKWQTHRDTCYRFWRIQGTDCAICMNVCPYAHPNTLLHGVVRWAIRRNGLARRLALVGDDYFYGRTPRDVIAPPRWHDTAGQEARMPRQGS